MNRIDQQARPPRLVRMPDDVAPNDPRFAALCEELTSRVVQSRADMSPEKVGQLVREAALFQLRWGARPLTAEADV